MSVHDVGLERLFSLLDIQMRRVNPSRFRVATRGTSREINRSIVLNLVRAHQPISRADLARAMDVRRGAVSLIVNDLLRDGLIFEGATGETVRGRKPTFLYIDSRRRAVVAADIRASETFVMLADLLGKPIDRRRSAFRPCAIRRQLVETLADAHQARCSPITPRSTPAKASAWWCPAWSSTRRCACCTRRRSAGATSICASRSPRPPACRCRSRTPAAPARSRRRGRCATTWPAPSGDLVFVSVSDGVGVGVMIHGEVLRGRHNIAGEFGHVPLSLDGPRCSCGSNGCWEAYVSNPRHAGALLRPRRRSVAGRRASSSAHFTVEDLIARARARDAKASAALDSHGPLPRASGLASVINVLDPARVYVGGEITLAWDLIESHRARGAGRARADRRRPPRPTSARSPATEYPRLRGAAALVAAPAFAAPVVA